MEGGGGFTHPPGHPTIHTPCHTTRRSHPPGHTNTPWPHTPWPQHSPATTPPCEQTNARENITFLHTTYAIGNKLHRKKLAFIEKSFLATLRQTFHTDQKLKNCLTFSVAQYECNFRSVSLLGLLSMKMSVTTTCCRLHCGWCVSGRTVTMCSTTCGSTSHTSRDTSSAS